MYFSVFYSIAMNSLLYYVHSSDLTEQFGEEFDGRICKLIPYIWWTVDRISTSMQLKGSRLLNSDHS